MQIKDKKIINLCFIIVFILASLLLVSINYYVDPYGYRYVNRKNSINLSINSLSSGMIYTYINKTKDVKVDSVLLGSSPVISFFDITYFSCYTGHKIASLAFPHMTLSETYDLLKYFLELHPEVKTVFVSIDVTTYLTNCSSDKLLSNKPRNFVRDFVKSYYSLDVLKLSIIKIKELLYQNNEKKDEYAENMRYNFNKKRKYFYPGMTAENLGCLKENINQLSKIKKLLDIKKLDAIYFLTPCHSLYFGNLYRIKQLEILEVLKKELVNVTPFYDMAFVNKYTSEPFEYLWADVTHSLSFVNSKVYDVFVYNQNDPEIVVLVNSENIEKILQQQKILIEEYVNKNSVFVNDYVNSNLSPIEVEAYSEFKSAPKLPDDIPLNRMCIAKYKGRL